MKSIPKHLSKYTVEQDYSTYTYEDQAVWRFTMRQLFSYLKDHAHSSYEEGLVKTGISIENIPKISEMNEKLSEFGWRAVPVSGFIPPAAFMSFQAHRILPIASEMRSLEHILYTPAPDIVHEAAGHAPILIDPDFTNYLGSYADIAKKAIISSEDLALYEAIRELSDIKEKQGSTDEDIQQAEDKLNTVSKNMTYVSEAQLLGRMNWWTAEYGLIGDLNDPKIFGAGILSSIGEARNSLKGPKHIEFSTECLEYTYDITEQQPQLFVAKDFKSLTSALDEMSETMAFKQGGEAGLKKAKRAKSVCTICLDDSSTYSGVLKDFEIDNNELKKLVFKNTCLVNDKDLRRQQNQTFEFKNKTVTSVYGGPSSFENYPLFEDFVAKKITKNPVKSLLTEELLKDIRSFRESGAKDRAAFNKLTETYFEHSDSHWLAGLELLELEPQHTQLKEHLVRLKEHESADTKKCIDLGISLIN